VCFDLLKEYCQEVFVSKRADQDLTAFGARKLLFIDDVLEDAGPLGGIFSAMQKYPESAWLVVACDLPYIEKETLDHLIRHRDRSKMATAFCSVHDQRPEPLCAIYEPAIGPAVCRTVLGGHRCPRKILIDSDILLLDSSHPLWLENINTTQDYLSASAYFSREERTGA